MPVGCGAFIDGELRTEASVPAIGGLYGLSLASAPLYGIEGISAEFDKDRSLPVPTAGLEKL